MDVFDMFDPFIVPLWIDPNAISVWDQHNQALVTDIAQAHVCLAERHF